MKRSDLIIFALTGILFGTAIPVMASKTISKLNLVIAGQFQLIKDISAERDLAIEAVETSEHRAKQALDELHSLKSGRPQMAPLWTLPE